MSGATHSFVVGTLRLPARFHSNRLSRRQVNGRTIIGTASTQRLQITSQDCRRASRNVKNLLVTINISGLRQQNREIVPIIPYLIFHINYIIVIIFP